MLREENGLTKQLKVRDFFLISGAWQPGWEVGKLLQKVSLCQRELPSFPQTNHVRGTAGHCHFFLELFIKLQGHFTIPFPAAHVGHGRVLK